MFRSFCYPFVVLALTLAAPAIAVYRMVERVVEHLLTPFIGDARSGMSFAGDVGSFWSPRAIDPSLSFGNRHEAGVSRRSAARNT